MVHRRRLLIIALVLILVGTFAIWMPALRTPRHETPEPAPAPLAEQPDTAVESTAPDALPLLNLMPDSAAVGIAFPPMQRPFERATRLAKRIASRPDDIDAAIQRTVQGFARDLGVPDAESFSAIATQVGLDPGKPLAVFAAADAIEALLAAADAGENRPKGAVALVVPVQNAERVQSLLEELRVEVATGEATVLEPVHSEHGVAIHHAPMSPETGFETLAWTVDSSLAIVGTSLELVRAILDRRANPEPVEYGTPAFPAEYEDEIIQLVRTDRIINALDSATSTTRDRDVLRALLLNVNPDLPAITTLVIHDDFVQLASKAKVAPQTDAESLPSPLRLPERLPEDNAAYLGLALDPASKNRILELWKAALPAEMQTDPELPEVEAAFKNLLDTLGDEIILAISPAGVAWPSVCLVARLNDDVAARKLIASYGLPIDDGNPPGNGPIQSLQLGWPFTLYYVIRDGNFLAGNDRAQIEAQAARVAAGPPSDAPVATPQLGILVIHDRFFELPLLYQAAATASGNTELDDTLARLRAVVRELRFEATIVDNRAVTRFTVQVKP